MEEVEKVVMMLDDLGVHQGKDVHQEDEDMTGKVGDQIPAEMEPPWDPGTTATELPINACVTDDVGGEPRHGGAGRLEKMADVLGARGVPERDKYGRRHGYNKGSGESIGDLERVTEETNENLELEAKEENIAE